MADNRPKRPYDRVINRWTGEPHEHRREIARRERQQKAASAS